MAWWSMHKELWGKVEVQRTTVVKYSVSCTNKHDKLTDTSIQVLCNASIQLHVATDIPCYTDMVNHVMNNETTNITVTPY